MSMAGVTMRMIMDMRRAAAAAMIVGMIGAGAAGFDLDRRVPDAEIRFQMLLQNR